MEVVFSVRYSEIIPWVNQINSIYRTILRDRNRPKVQVIRSNRVETSSSCIGLDSFDYIDSTEANG